MKLRHIAVLAGLAVTISGGAVAQDSWPSEPVRVIVPTDAGGSVDSIARIVQRYVEASDALGEKLVVVNMPGAGGTIATRTVKDAEADGYTIGLWHEGLVTSAVMGVADYDHTDFRVLGGTGYTEIGLAVGANNEIQSFERLIDAAREAPNEVLVATNVGLAVHFIPLMLQDRAGVEFRYVQVGGGAKRFPSVAAGHTDTAIFGASELIKWAGADLTPIVFFSEERIPELPDVPTAREMGIDMVADGHRIWIAPKDTPDEVATKLTDVLRAAVESDEGRESLVSGGFRAVFIEPEDVEGVLDGWKTNAEQLVDQAMTLRNN